MKLEFQPISSIVDANEWLPFVEVLALFNGSCAIDDLDWDDEPLLTSLLEDTADLSLRSDYEAERTTGVQVAKDRFISDLMERLAERYNLLGASYPFNIGDDGVVLLKTKSSNDVTEAGLAYLWISLFNVVSSATDYLIIAKEDKSGFIREFANVFEYICCMAMISREPSMVWYFGDSRDITEFLHRLEMMVNAVGSGAVKSFNQLEANQTGTNDGGVDIFLVPTNQGNIPPHGNAYLVGVTIQKTDRVKKIIGHDEIGRYRGYFLPVPMLVYNGILAIPFEGTDIDKANCRDRNCGYITINDILRFLADYPSSSPSLRCIRSPRRKMRKKSRDLQATAKLVNKGNDLRIALG